MRPLTVGVLARLSRVVESIFFPVHAKHPIWVAFMLGPPLVATLRWLGTGYSCCSRLLPRFMGSGHWQRALAQLGLLITCKSR